MADSQWRGASVLLTLTFVLAISAVSRMEAQPNDPALIQPQCNPRSPDTAINSLTPAELTNSLPCAEVFGAFPPPPPPLDSTAPVLQKGFDFLSWMSFLALNAPVDGHDITAVSDAPAKWEDPRNFRQLAEVMRDPKRPLTKADWGRRELPDLCKPKFKDGMIVLHVIEEAFNQPFRTGPLIDQNGRYALFDILMNKTMFDYIVDNNLFTQAGQVSRPADFVVDFPSGANVNNAPLPGMSVKGQVGSIMLKVSWKILDPVKDKDLDGKIHKAKALIFMPPEPGKPATCSDPVDVGLIGFHLVHKTASRRQWIWTTFEHVQNAPEERALKDPAKLLTKYLFFDVANPKGPFNQTPDRPWDPREQPFRDGFKSQITRVIPVPDDTQKMNGDFQARLANTVWKNYMLLNTQWPSTPGCSSNPVQDSKGKQPDMTCEPVPTFLANSTLETFTQGSTPLASSSCMSCHNNATSQQRPAAQSDFTFILEKAK
jgi:hypothetical protein